MKIFPIVVVIVRLSINGFQVNGEGLCYYICELQYPQSQLPLCLRWSNEPVNQFYKDITDHWIGSNNCDQTALLYQLYIINVCCFISEINHK